MDEVRKVYRRFGLAISFFIFVWALVIPTFSHADSLSTQTHATAGKLTVKLIEVKDGTIVLLLNDGLSPRCLGPMPPNWSSTIALTSLLAVRKSSVSSTSKVLRRIYTDCQKFCPLFSPLPSRGEDQGEG
jgi:hypothetical protein